MNLTEARQQVMAAVLELATTMPVTIKPAKSKQNAETVAKYKERTAPDLIGS
jgi:hypothetical protein